MEKVFLFLADGFEETEAIAVADVLLRGGIELYTVSISDNKVVKGAHGISVVADQLLSQIETEKAKCLVFPGGMPGAKNIAENKKVIELLQHHYDQNGWVAAICAAPALVLSQLKTDRKLQVTCYPGFEQYLPYATVLSDGVVVDGKVITGKGPGFAIEFGLTVLKHLVSPEMAKEVAAGMLL